MASNKLLKNITKNSTAYLTFFLLLVLIVISLKFNREGFTRGGDLRLESLVPQGLNGPTGPTGTAGRAGDTHLNIIRNNQEIQNLFDLTNEDLNSDTAIGDKVVTHIVDQIFTQINEGSDELEDFETNMFQKISTSTTLPTISSTLPTFTGKKIKAGTIIAWHISSESPPENEWQLCNGEPLQTQQFSNDSYETIPGYSVPDLTGRFILGGGYSTNFDGENLSPTMIPIAGQSSPPNGGYGDLPPSTLHTETVRMNTDDQINPTALRQHRGRGKVFQYTTEVKRRGQAMISRTHIGGTYIKLQRNDLPNHSHSHQIPHYYSQVNKNSLGAPRDDLQQCRPGEIGCNVTRTITTSETAPYGSDEPEKISKLPPFLNLRHYIKKPKDLIEFECDYLNGHEGVTDVSCE